MGDIFAVVAVTLRVNLRMETPRGVVVANVLFDTPVVVAAAGGSVVVVAGAGVVVVVVVAVVVEVVAIATGLVVGMLSSGKAAWSNCLELTVLLSYSQT